MKKYISQTIYLLIILVVIGPIHCASAYDNNPIEATTISKYRILVDKVLSKENDWIMTKDHVRQIAEAGFNVISPRYGADNNTEIQTVARYAKQHGVYYLPWMRGTLHTQGRHKLVDETGLEHPICSPNSDELWDWISERILSMAKISKDENSLIGVFLDFENYSFEKQPDKRTGHAYPLSYDDLILKEFSKQYQVKIPKLKKTKRYVWLIENGYHDIFEKFQLNKWKQRAADLRAAIDQINPNFQFFIYPAGDTLFLDQVAFEEWATDQAPLVVAESKTFGRPSTKMLQNPALKANRDIIQQRNTELQSSKNLQYIGGINPLVNASDPEFSARNAVMMSQYSNGFWVFYEGPRIGENHEAYWNWFGNANKAIQGEQFDFWKQNRITEETVISMSLSEIVNRLRGEGKK